MTYKEAIKETQNPIFINLTIKDLAKYTPRKPKKYDSLPFHRCPNCGGAIRIYSDDPYNKFCKFCGQAIDWREEE